MFGNCQLRGIVKLLDISLEAVPLSIVVTVAVGGGEA